MIVRNRQIADGRPRIAQTRIEIGHVIDLIKGGANIQEVLNTYDKATRDDVLEFMAIDIIENHGHKLDYLRREKGYFIDGKFIKFETNPAFKKEYHEFYVYLFIKAFYKSELFYPTTREIQTAFGIGSTQTTHNKLLNLVKLGLLIKNENGQYRLKRIVLRELLCK